MGGLGTTSFCDQRWVVASQKQNEEPCESLFFHVRACVHFLISEVSYNVPTTLLLAVVRSHLRCVQKLCSLLQGVDRLDLSESRPKPQLLLDELTKRSALHHFDELEECIRSNCKRTAVLVREGSDQAVDETRKGFSETQRAAARLSEKVHDARAVFHMLSLTEFQVAEMARSVTTAITNIQSELAWTRQSLTELRAQAVQAQEWRASMAAERTRSSASEKEALAITTARLETMVSHLDKLHETAASATVGAPTPIASVPSARPDSVHPLQQRLQQQLQQPQQPREQPQQQQQRQQLEQRQQQQHRRKQQPDPQPQQQQRQQLAVPGSVATRNARQETAACHVPRGTSDSSPQHVQTANSSNSADTKQLGSGQTPIVCTQGGSPFRASQVSGVDGPIRRSVRIARRIAQSANERPAKTPRRGTAKKKTRKPRAATKRKRKTKRSSERPVRRKRSHGAAHVAVRKKTTVAAAAKVAKPADAWLDDLAARASSLKQRRTRGVCTSSEVMEQRLRTYQGVVDGMCSRQLPGEQDRAEWWLNL